MQAHEFRRLLGLLETLTAEQWAQLKLRLVSGGGAHAVTGIIEGRLGSRLCCPRCQARHVVRNGHGEGLERYQCRVCGRSVNALTGTALARLRQREKWLAQASVLEAGLSVRKAALQRGVHRTTAFRWRPRFLRLASAVRATALAGVAEADETSTLRSYQGQRRRLLAEQTRPPRRRGGRATQRGLSSEPVPILVLRDRSGQTADFVLERADTAHIAPALDHSLAEEAILCYDSSAALAAAAKDRGIEPHAINSARGERRRGPWPIQNLNAYHSRYKNWMRRFYGVATSYLPNSLGGFRALDRNAQSDAPSATFLALTIGA